MKEPDAEPNPAREELDRPHLDAEDLEQEIGDSEPWDEATVEPDEDSDRSG